MQTASERWIHGPNDILVTAAKATSDWGTANATVDAVRNVLVKTGEVFVSEVGDVDVFLYVTTPIANKVHASVVTRDPDNADKPFKVLRDSENNGARELVAAFLCDFPNAVFTLSGGKPLWLFIHNEVSKVPDKKWVTLANVAAAVRSGNTKFAIAVPKPADPAADDASGVVTTTTKE